MLPCLVSPWFGLEGKILGLGLNINVYVLSGVVTSAVPADQSIYCTKGVSPSTGKLCATRTTHVKLLTKALFTLTQVRCGVAC